MSKKNNQKKDHFWKIFRNRIWFVINTIFTLIYLIWRLFFTIPTEYGLISSILGISLFTVEFLGALEAIIHFFNMHKVVNYPVPEVSYELFPHVDVFIATYKEDVDLLYKTINGCLHMEYPDKNKVHIYLCDDGNRKEAKELASKFGIHYITREDNVGAKAGNLNNALKIAKSPLVVTFDSDMIPRNNFLMKTVPFFVDAEAKNKDLGFVQTPQSFYNPDLFQFNLFSENKIPNEQDYFYKDIQVSRNKTNSVIYGGSNTVLSRKAIDEVGGFYTKSITEDFATGILIQKKGYKCIATNEVLASGISPTDLLSLIKQRNRWARGVISSGRKLNVLFTPELKFAQRINYMASIWYWYAPLKRLIYFLSPIMYGVFGIMVIKCNLWQILLFWLPMYISSTISLRMLSRNIRTSKWTSIYETVLFPFMIGPVILESFGISLKKFNVTKKDSGSKKANFMYAVPFLLLVILSVVGIVKSIGIMISSNSPGAVVILFWLIINLFSLIMAILFILGRSFYRKSERVVASLECEVFDGMKRVSSKTKDFSEKGIAILFQRPEDIDFEDLVTISLWNDRYFSKLKSKLVYVAHTVEGWKYAFEIVEYYDTYNDYLQLLYDRVPTLPQTLDEETSSFDELRNNLTRRVKDPFFEKRHLPRITLNTRLKSIEGREIEIVDYNYKYLSLKDDNPPKEINLQIKKNLVFHCIRKQEIRKGLVLYLIDNYKEIHENAFLRSIRNRWIDEHIKIKNPDVSNGTTEIQQEQFEMKYV